MSSDGSRTSSSSRLSQFGLYRSIDARTEEFLRLSRKRQIRQGCACAAVSTAITVTVVVTVLLVYEYSMNPQSKPDRKPARKPNWLGMFNETSTFEKFNKPKVNVDPTSFKLLPMILSALNHNRYLEKLLEDPSTNAPYDKKSTTEFSYKMNVFSDAKNWMKTPSKTHTTEYKSGPILSYKPAASNLEEYKKMRKLRDYHRMFRYFDKIINDKVTLSTEDIQTEKPMTVIPTSLAIIPTKYHKQTTTTAQEETTEIMTNLTPQEKDTGNCLCLKKFALLLNKFVVGIQELISEIMSGKMPCHEEDIFPSTPTTIEAPVTSTTWRTTTSTRRSTTKQSLSTSKPKLTSTKKRLTTTNPTLNSENSKSQSTNLNYEAVTKIIYNPKKIKPINLNQISKGKSLPSGGSDDDLDPFDIQNILLKTLLKPINDMGDYRSNSNVFTDVEGHAVPTEPYDNTLHPSTKPMKNTSRTRTTEIPIPKTEFNYFDNFITSRAYEIKVTSTKPMKKLTTRKMVTTKRPPTLTSEFTYIDESPTTISAHDYDFMDIISPTENILNENYDLNKLTINVKSDYNTKGIKPRQFSEKIDSVSKTKLNQERVMNFRKMGKLVRTSSEKKNSVNTPITSTLAPTTIKTNTHTDNINLKPKNVSKTEKLNEKETTNTANKLFPFQEGEEETRLANEIDFQEEEILKEVDISIKKSEKVRKKRPDEMASQSPSTVTPIRNKVTARSMLPKSRPSYLEIQRNSDWKQDTQDYDTNIDLHNYDLF